MSGNAALKIDGFEKQKVLFFDDDRLTQELVKSSLEDDFEVVCETSGALAIDSAEAVRPNIILLDLNMPNVDGFEVLKRLKSHPILSGIPIICVSGKQDESSRTRAYGLGAAGFISKPINVSQMSSDIKALVKSMNVELVSIDRRRHLFVGFNSAETQSRLKMDLGQTLAKGDTAVVFSFQEGQDFFQNDLLQEDLSSGRLMYLQIKPVLLTRLPYLEDLSPLIQDVQDFSPRGIGSSVLFFESPEVVIDINAKDRFTATSILLSETLSRHFQSVRYYSKALQDPALAANLNSMAKILVGG